MGRVALVAILLVGATLAVYGRTVRFDFVEYDDYHLVLYNPAIPLGLSPEGLRWSFTAFHRGNWTPLAWISYQLDHEIAGLDPAWYHGVNVALHAANTLLAFLVLRSMTGALWRSAFAAALFGVHPLHVESVAWVAERRDVLSALFWWLAIASWVAYARRGGAWRYGRTALCLALGLLAKQMLVTLPVVLLLLDAWPLRRLASDAGSPLPPERRRTPRALVREKVPLLALCAAASVVTVLAQQSIGATIYSERIPLLARATNAVVSCVRYLGKALWPTDLSPMYAHPNLPGGIPWSVLEIGGAAALLAGLSALAWRARRRGYPLVGWLWFLVTLSPVIGLLQVGFQAMADRYTYLPHIGLYLVVAWAAGDALERLGRGARVAFAGAAVLVLAALGAAASAQSLYWRDAMTLHGRALSMAEGTNAVMHFNYANELKRRGGNLDEVIEHYRRALELEPGAAQVHHNLANTLRSRGELELAIHHYEEALKALGEPRAGPEDSGAAMRDLVGRALLETRGRLEDTRLQGARP